MNTCMVLVISFQVELVDSKVNDIHHCMSNATVMIIIAQLVRITQGGSDMVSRAHRIDEPERADRQ